MKQNHCLPVLVVALAMAYVPPVRGESRFRESATARAEAARFEELRHEFASVRGAYFQWTGSETRTSSARGPESGPAGRQAGLEYEYYRLEDDMRDLAVRRARRAFNGGMTEEMVGLRDRARRLLAALRAVEAGDRLGGRSAAVGARSAAAAPVSRGGEVAGRGGAKPRASYRSQSPHRDSDFTEWTTRGLDLDPSSREYRILSQAEAALAGIRQRPTAELCRRGWERLSGRGSAPESAQSGHRGRLDSYSRMVPRLERSLALMRDSAANDETGAPIAGAADRLLAALAPYGEALSGCTKSDRGLCGRWQPPERSDLRLQVAANRALPWPAISGPGSDTCASATAIANGSYSGDTTGGSSDGESSCGSSGASPDVWFSYSAAADETILFSTLGSSYDTVLSLHDSCPGDLVSELACNDDWAGGQSQISWDVEAGSTYYIRVSGFNGDAGAYVLSVGPAGSISGTITEAATEDPLEWVDVWIVDHWGNDAGWAYTDASGSYTAADLPAGDYYAHTGNWGEYVDELYKEPDNLPCPYGSCAYSSGTPIPVALGTDTGGVDFALEPGGSIVGSITDAANGDYLEAGVDIFDTSGNHLTGGWGSPAYAASGLPSGSYFALTWNNDGYFNEIYDDLLCPNPWGCDVTAGALISVTAPAVTAGIDFALVKGGSISGRLVDEVTGLPVGGGVHIIASTWEHIQDAHPDEAGNYTTPSGLTTGVYFARSFNWDGYVNELFDDILCPDWCDERLGSPIAVTSGSDTGGVDLALKKEEGAIAGRVTDGVTGWPIANVTVNIYDSGGGYYTDGYTDEDGNYISNGSLSPGTYYAVTSNEDDYDDELWEETDCSGGCEPTTGTAIDVINYVLGIDFTLEKGGAITGQITDDTSAAPLEGVWVSIYDSGGGWVTDAYTDAAGNYISWHSLDPGTYYAVTYNEQGYFDELYDNLDCSNGCDPTDGDPIEVSSYATDIDFALTKGGGISGTITDAATGTPLEGVEVWIDKLEPWGTDGFGRAVTDAAGDYVSERGLVTGSYVATTNSWHGYINELYDVGYCLGSCDLAVGTPIPVTGGATTPGVDFALDRGATISGQITDAITGAPVGGSITIVDFDDNWVAHSWTDGGGLYSTQPGLPPGSYFASTDNRSGYVNETYDGFEAPGSAFGGTPIALTEPPGVTGIDFALEKGAVISGQVTDAVTTDPLGGWCYWVEIYDVAGHWVTGVARDDDGNYWTEAGMPAGTYHALAYGWPCGYATEAWDRLACPWSWCDLTETTPIAVASADPVAGINFALDGQGSIAGWVTDDDPAANPLAVELYFFDASGREIWGQPGGGMGYYSSPDDLCAGDYYVRTLNFDGFVDEVYDDTPCAGCDPTTGTAVAVSGGPVDGVNFALSTGGAISGQVTTASDSSPLPDVFVLFINAATGWAASYTETDGSGNYTSWGALTSGTYYVTTENEQGYVDELHDGADGVACPGPLGFTWSRGCSLAAGTPIAVTSPNTTSDIDFVLDAGGGIAGTVSSALTGEPLQAEVWIYDSSGTHMEDIWTDTGDYASVYGLPAGNYYLHTRNSWAHPEECYQDLPCPGGICDPTLGTPIVVSAGTMTYGIDLQLGSFTCDPLPSVIDVTGRIDYPAIFLACSEIRVWNCEVGPNGELDLVSGDTVVLVDDVSVMEGAELTIRIQQ